MSFITRHDLKPPTTTAPHVCELGENAVFSMHPDHSEPHVAAHLTQSHRPAAGFRSLRFASLALVSCLPALQSAGPGQVADYLGPPLFSIASFLFSAAAAFEAALSCKASLKSPGGRLSTGPLNFAGAPGWRTGRCY